MLSPGYMDFVTRSVGMILASAAFKPIHTVESNHLIMVALYMSQDAEAKAMFLHQLETYGDFVCESWHKIYKSVHDSNVAGQNAATENVNQILKRIAKQ